MSARIAVYVYGTDLVSQAGVAAELRGRPEAYVVDDHAIDDAAVAVVVVDAIDDQLVRVVRGVQRGGCPPVVVVAGAFSDVDLATTADAGVVGVLRRQEVTPECLARAVVAAARGERIAAPRAVAPAGSSARDGHGRLGLVEREVQVLALLADGLDTQEIADRLAYSERTIKGIIHGVTTRLHLRNRSHAVAFAIKSGVL